MRKFGGMEQQHIFTRVSSPEFCLGQLVGLDNAQSVLCGVGTSGYYVRNGRGPTVEELAGFMLDWPESPAS